MAEPGERVSEGIGDFSFEEHLDAQRQDAQQATRCEPDHFQRHDRFVQAPLLFDQIGKTEDVPRAAGRRHSSFERGPPQPDDRLHGFDIFRTNLHAEVTACAVPDPMLVLER